MKQSEIELEWHEEFVSKKAVLFKYGTRKVLVAFLAYFVYNDNDCVHWSFYVYT